MFLFFGKTDLLITTRCYWSLQHCFRSWQWFFFLLPIWLRITLLLLFIHLHTEIIKFSLNIHRFFPLAKLFRSKNISRKLWKSWWIPLEATIARTVHIDRLLQWNAVHCLKHQLWIKPFSRTKLPMPMFGYRKVIRKPKHGRSQVLSYSNQKLNTLASCTIAISPKHTQQSLESHTKLFFFINPP